MERAYHRPQTRRAAARDACVPVIFDDFHRNQTDLIIIFASRPVPNGSTIVICYGVRRVRRVEETCALSLRSYIRKCRITLMRTRYTDTVVVWHILW